MLLRGRINLRSKRSGHTIKRFSVLERVIHWSLAASFLILAMTGLNKTIGGHLVPCLVGPEKFTAWSSFARQTHRALSYVFCASILAAAILWVRDNLFQTADLTWLRVGGVFIGAEHMPAHRFNAGQKVLFWIVLAGGFVLALTGCCLMWPDAILAADGQRVAGLLHGLIGVLLAAAMLAHIYIGSIGSEGTLEGMITGRVDESWAHQHHSLWADKVMAAGASAASGQID
jgi:formate dehydrogenase subunit gamma